MEKRYWLMKSEPSVYSIDDLKRDRRTAWDGVRNFQARNFLRDQVKDGDLVLFYHSSRDPVGIAGLARVCKEGYPDFTAWDRKHKHFDPKSTRDKPIWFMVDLAFEQKFPHLVSLESLRKMTALKELMVLKRGMRLSVQPVKAEHFAIICQMGNPS